MVDWMIVDSQGLVDHQSFPPRPADATPSTNPYTPWYQRREHLHVEDGVIVSIHAQGSHPDQLKALLRRCQKEQAKVFERFDSSADSLPLSSVLDWLGPI